MWCAVAGSGATRLMRSSIGAGRAIFVGILVATCLAAVAFAAWALAIEARTDAAVAGAVILLALAQLFALLARLSAEDRQGRSSRDMVRAASDIGREMGALRRRIDIIEERQMNERPGAGEHLTGQIAALERTVSALASRLETTASLPPGRQAATAPPLAPVAGNDDRDGGSRGGERDERDIDLFLAPVVRLASGQTSYYRATSNARSPADETRLIARIITVLRHLDRRGRAVGIFCPLSAEAFADNGFLGRLVRFLRRNEDVAGKLVIEISQADLARLTQAGMRGLAWLAQLGATFSLAAASPAGPDLAALHELGFQFVDVDIQALPGDNRDRLDALTAFAAEAQRNELTVMAGPVADGADLAWLQHGASLGHGAHFARPRRVRPDFGERQEPRAAA